MKIAHLLTGLFFLLFNWPYISATANHNPDTSGSSAAYSVPAELTCPEVSFAYSGLCAGLGTSFTPSFSGSGTPAYHWDFGDPASGASNTSTLQSPSHTFALPGTYTVTMTVTHNTPGCASIIEYSSAVTICGLSDPSFTYSILNGTGQVQFNDPGYAYSGSYSWDFGDPASGSNNSSTLLAPVHTYTASGTYTVSFTTTSTGGESCLSRVPISCQYTSQQIITVSICPVPLFTVNLQYCPGEPLTFALVGRPVTDAIYSWDFGDGTTDTGPIVSHPYAQGGIYSVTLTMTLASGCTNTYTFDPITINDHPDASFSVSTGLAGVPVTFTPNTSLPGDWDFGDGSTLNAIAGAVTHTYQAPGNYTIEHVVAGPAGAAPGTSCESTSTVLLTIKANTTNCCSSTFPVPGIGTSSFDNIGGFHLDPSSGQILYKLQDCPGTYGYNCLWGNSAGTRIDSVVASGAVTFSDEFNTSAPVSANPYEAGDRGKWRVQEQYAYRDVLNTYNEKRNYNAGRYSMMLFNWKHPHVNDARWVKTSTVNRYSSNGEPLEDQNILGIKSTAKYGINKTLPVLVAQNAAEGSVSFEGFENLYAGPGGRFYFEDQLLYTSDNGIRVYKGIGGSKAHTGNYSVQLSDGEAFLIANVLLNQQTASRGLLVRAWLSPRSKDVSITNKVSAHYGTSTIPMTPVSSAGEWTLFEAYIPATAAAGTLAVHISVDEYGVYMDDVRVQPLESEMVCYVYDNVQRILAVLDDQHYAMMYEYNAEGALIRKLKETVEGVKTISETQYNSKGEPRQ